MPAVGRRRHGGNLGLCGVRGADGGMQVSGLALDRAGDLWITYSKGTRP
jgi:hypothetical protein